MKKAANKVLELFEANSVILDVIEVKIGGYFTNLTFKPLEGKCRDLKPLEKSLIKLCDQLKWEGHLKEYSHAESGDKLVVSLGLHGIKD